MILHRLLLKYIFAPLFGIFVIFMTLLLCTLLPWVFTLVGTSDILHMAAQ